MNNTTLILGIIVALLVGGFSGYTMGQKGGAANTDIAQIQQMTDMMKTDGINMKKMGGMMMAAGMMMEERGTKYSDEELVMKGKDLTANGKKHMEDGTSMTEGDMMGMTASGNMADMPGMNMEGMDHSKM